MVDESWQEAAAERVLAGLHRWVGRVLWLGLVVGVVGVVGFLVLAFVPSAGAAGGCGGG